MKTTVFFLLLVLAVSPVYAVSTNVEPKDHSGDCGSVGTGADAGSDPKDVVIDGLVTLAKDNVYSATGGNGEYTFSSSCVNIDSSSGQILDTNDCCTDTIKVTDTGSGEDHIDIRKSGGTWVQKSTETFEGCTANFAFLYSIIISGDTKTRYSYGLYYPDHNIGANSYPPDCPKIPGYPQREDLYPAGPKKGEHWYYLYAHARQVDISEYQCPTP